MNNVAKNIEDLLLYAETAMCLGIEDKTYARNALYELFQVEPETVVPESRPREQITDELVRYAIETGISEEGTELRFETRLMGIVTPPPGVVVDTFQRLYNFYDPQQATRYLYKLSILSNYIRLDDIRKNVCWYAKGDKGNIAITINLAKPEKDPKQVLAEKAFKGKQYPKCMLCLENLGFCGTPTRPARQNLRVVPFKLNEENWHMQYSPYLYYDEHCIVFRDEHVPMKITEETMLRLTEFVGKVPTYFLGSNADLPIVGGSILSHDHYQGGRKVLPMFKAKMRKLYEATNGITIGVKDWYNSVITIKGLDRFMVADRAWQIAEAWQNYSDESVNIICSSGEERHNTVTPIAYIEGRDYVIDLILRNNRTDAKHPYGIFHPTEDMHNIKKEAIGLIEAMGLFILPGRLKSELFALMKEIRKKEPDLKTIFEDPVLNKHANLLVQAMACDGKGLTEKEARDAILNRVNDTCFRILECTAVFKNTPVGQAAFDKFMMTVASGKGVQGMPNQPKRRGRPPMGPRV